MTRHGSELNLCCERPRPCPLWVKSRHRGLFAMSAYPPKAYIRGLAARAKGGDGIMKAFVFACIAAVVIAIIGAIVLGGMQELADHAFSSSAVRLGP